VTGQQIKYN